MLFNILNMRSSHRRIFWPVRVFLQGSVQYTEHLFRMPHIVVFNRLNGYSMLCTSKPGWGDFFPPSHTKYCGLQLARRNRVQGMHYKGESTMPTGETSPATAVERALNILEAAANRRDGMTNSEISYKLGIPKSSASYILRTLDRRGYLRRDEETGRYRLGLKVLSLGGDARANLDLAELALPFMRALQERIHLTIHLAVLDHGEAVYIEKVEAPGFFKVNTWVGRRMYLHSTSVGKCLLAWLPKQEVETLLREQGMKKRTPKTISSVPKLLSDLEHVREQAYAVDDEENSLGARCVGAPIFDPAGNVSAALGVSGTLTQMDADNLPKIVEALKEAARRISRQLSRGGA